MPRVKTTRTRVRRQKPYQGTVLLADAVNSRLISLSQSAGKAGFSVLLADSSAHCISLCAAYEPDVVLIDQDFLAVDEWSVPEQLRLVSPGTAIVMSVEDCNQWEPLPPFVNAVAKRNDRAKIISILRGMLLAGTLSLKPKPAFPAGVVVS